MIEQEKIEELVLSCENQQNYVRNLIDYCVKNSKNYKMLEMKFMNEIQRKYDHIINVLLKIISPKILIKIIKNEDNETKIINYLLKFKNINTVELFLDIIISKGEKHFVEQMMNKKYTYEQSTYNFTLHISFLNIIIFKSINWGGHNKTISQQSIVKIFKKIKNLNQYLEINEFCYYWSNYMIFVCEFNFENVIEIINILINSLDNKTIYELLKIKIYYNKSMVETKLNLFEYVIVKLMNSNTYVYAIKLVEFFIDELDNNYVNFVLDECDLNLIIANSLQSEYWNKNQIFNLIWRDDYLKHIEPSKIFIVSYWKTSILYEALCNKNVEFVKKILLNVNTSRQINFNIKYEHYPEYSGIHTFITLALFYVGHPNCAKIKNNFIDILNICFDDFKNIIDFTDCKCIQYIIKNCFDDFFKLNEKNIYDNLNKFNFELIKLEKINEFKKIKQTNISVKTFLDRELYVLCEKNNVEFAKYIIDKYFEFNSIEDIEKSNCILNSFELVCENNYTKLSDLLFDKFIKLHLDMLVSLKFDNFKTTKELTKNKSTKSTKLTKSPKYKNYYLNEIVEYCCKNNNHHMIEKLFDSKYKFNYFVFVDKDETFLLKLIKHNFPNKFIIKVINKLGENCYPQHLNKKMNHTALTLSSIKNNFEVFNVLMNKFGEKVHPVI